MLGPAREGEPCASPRSYQPSSEAFSSAAVYWPVQPCCKSNRHRSTLKCKSNVMASRARCRPDKGGLVCDIAVRADEAVPVPDTKYRLLIPVFRNEVGIEGDAILDQFAELEADPGKPLFETTCGCAGRRVNHTQIHDGALSP